MREVKVLWLIILVGFSMCAAGCNKEDEASKPTPDQDQATALDCSVVVAEFPDLAGEASSLSAQSYSQRVSDIVKALDSGRVRALASVTPITKVRAEIVACLLRAHSAIETVDVNPTGSAVNFLDSEAGEWVSVLVQRPGG